MSDSHEGFLIECVSGISEPCEPTELEIEAFALEYHGSHYWNTLRQQSKKVFDDTRSRIKNALIAAKSVSS